MNNFTATNVSKQAQIKRIESPKKKNKMSKNVKKTSFVNKTRYKLTLFVKIHFVRIWKLLIEPNILQGYGLVL